MTTDAGPVGTTGESHAFEFDQTASQALRRVVESDGFGYVGERFCGDGGHLI